MMIYLYKWVDPETGIQHYTTAENRRIAIKTWKRSGINVPSTARLERN